MVVVVVYKKDTMQVCARKSRTESKGSPGVDGKIGIVVPSSLRHFVVKF
jgi:hypothetical protein